MELTFRTIDDDNGKKLDKMFGVKPSHLSVEPSGCIISSRFVFFGSKIRDMEVYDDDVWVVSHPRTGSHWAQEMVWCIGNNFDFEKAKIPFTERSPLLESSGLLITGPVVNFYSHLGDSVETVEKMARPRYIKSHLPWELLPQQFHEKKPKVVYIIRNPKDTCVSYYHYFKLMYNMEGTFSEFAELFLNNSAPMGPLWKQALEFWKRRDEENILFLTYEEMKTNQIGVIKKTADFLGKQCNDEQAKELAKHLEFSKMAANPSINRANILPNNNDDNKFIRKGIIGDWKNHMDEDLSRRFDEWTEKYFTKSGLIFNRSTSSEPTNTI